jgi:hypothetical protein
MDQIPGGGKFMGHVQTIGRNLRDEWNQVNRFTPKMGYQESFLESANKKLLTMPHKLQTIGHMFATSCGKFKRSCGKFKTLPGKFKRSCGKFKTLPGKFKRLGGKFKPLPGKFQRLDGKFQTSGLKLRTYVL